MDSYTNKVYIVVVNYNGWADTIECLESLLKIDFENYQIILVDNRSEDDSVRYFRLWAKGCLDVYVTPSNKHRATIYPPVRKPISFKEQNWDEFQENSSFLEKEKTSSPKIILIKSPVNGGFAYANNIAIKYSLAKNDFEYIWFINNDVVVDKSSLKELVDAASKKKDIGAAGSKILHYDDPSNIQNIGSLKGFVRPHVPIIKMNKASINNLLKKQVIYVNDIMGASLLVKKETILKIGFMPEDYFLYGEETEWNMRICLHGYKLAIITNSIVYHKKSATTGESSPMTIYLRARNPIIFYKKCFSYKAFLFYAVYHSGWSILRTIWRHPKKLMYAVKGVKDGLRATLGSQSRHTHRTRPPFF